MGDIPGRRRPDPHDGRGRTGIGTDSLAWALEGISGTASELVLMLYRRLPVSDCIVDEDPLLVASFLALALALADTS
ncbi:MAG: hypothetical protein ABSE98_10265 [Acidimicrobiales bacterium]